MTNLRVASCLSVAVVLTLTALGCGAGNYTPPASTVVSTSHPLVAQYNILHFQAGTTAWVEFGTDTKYGRQTSIQTSASATSGGQTLSILVAGMKPQTTYHMRAHAAWEGGTWVDQDHTFTTGALPTSASFPQIKVQTPTVGLTPAPGVELLSFIPPGPSLNIFEVVATDIQGNVIWYCPNAGAPFKLLQNGHYLINISTDLVEVDLTCTTIRDVSLTQVNQSLQAQGYDFGPINYFHHDMLELPNGHWIALGQVTKKLTNLVGYPGIDTVYGDVLVDIDPNGNVVWGWSTFDHLDVNRHLEGLPDWTHCNALVYTPDGNLLLSSRHQSWVMKIDYENGTGSGNLLWKLGEGGDFNITGSDPSQWFYAQHYPSLLSTNGSQMTLAIWDNGNLRIDSSGAACNPVPAPAVCYSRATIFEVDQDTSLATVQWQYLPGYFSFWGGSIDVLSNGDVEFDMSEPTTTTASQIMEVTQTDSPQIVWQMNTTNGNAYRGYRIPSLYPGVTWSK